MAREHARSDSPRKSPEEAFRILGNETRLEILLRLSTAEEPLTFSQLFDRVGYPTASNFTYHLNQLRELFVEKTGDRYRITGAGIRIIEAIQTGTVTETPTIDPTPIDQQCHFCGGTIRVQYADERLERFCTECPGMWGSGPDGHLGSLSLRPAGLADRTLEETVVAAWQWRLLELFAIAGGICPRCTGPLETDLTVCGHHQEEVTICDHCDNRYAGRIVVACRGCPFTGSGSLPILLLDNAEFLEFLIDNGLHPTQPESPSEYDRIVSKYAETVVSSSPPRLQLTFTGPAGSFSAEISAGATVDHVSRSGPDD